MCKKHFIIYFVITIYPFIYIFQGLDITDTGFYLSSFQMLPEEPASVSYSAVYWLTNFLGSYIDKLNIGLLGLKVAGVFLCIATSIAVYITLKNVVFNNFLMIFSIFTAYVYINKSVIMVWGYNNLTAFLFVIAGATLYFGLINGRLYLTGVSGLILGINIFVRTPNLLGIAMICVIPLYYIFLQNQLWKKMYVNLSYFIFGWLMGILGLIAILWKMGQWNLYMQGLQRLFAIAQNVESHHSGNLLIKKLIRDHFRAFVATVAVLLIIAILVYIYSHLPKNKIYEWLLIGTAALLGLIILPIKNLWQWAVPGTLYAVLLLFIIAHRKRNSNISLLSLIALCILFVVPLGSGNGIWNAIYGSWLAIPLVLSIIYEKGLAEYNYFRLDVNQRGFLYKAVTCILLLFSIVTAYQYTSRDTSNRFSMQYVIDHPRLRGIYTTQERAQIISEFIDEIETYVKPYDYLLAYNEISLIHYLTETKPWLNNPWPMLYSPQEFELRLYQKEQEIGELPIIVRATGNTSSREWPRQDTEFEDNDAEHKIRNIMDKYIHLREYKIVWKNDYFEILNSVKK